MSDSDDTSSARVGGRLQSVDSPLTERQRTILNVIRTSVTSRGYPPSIREIGDAVGLTSTSSVAHQLRTLERKGYLRRDPARSMSAAPTTRRPRRSPRSPDQTLCRSPRSSRFSDVSRRAGPSWPRKPSKTSFRCRVSWSARAHCS
jgi:repressor LexA